MTARRRFRHPSELTAKERKEVLQAALQRGAELTGQAMTGKEGKEEKVESHKPERDRPHLILVGYARRFTIRHDGTWRLEDEDEDQEMVGT